jgi:hypothetical protein
VLPQSVYAYLSAARNRGMGIRNGKGLDEMTQGTLRDKLSVRAPEICGQNVDGWAVTFKRRDEAPCVTTKLYGKVTVYLERTQRAPDVL